MDAGLPIATPTNPNLAGIKAPGSLGAQTGNPPLVGFEALLSAHFAAVDQNNILGNGAVAVCVGPAKLAPQAIPDDETAILTSVPGKSPKDTFDIVKLEPNLSQGAQALAALLAGPQTKIVTADITAAAPEVDVQTGRASRIAPLLNDGTLAEDLVGLDGKPPANADLTLAEPFRLNSTGGAPNLDQIAANLSPAGSKTGHTPTQKSADAPVVPATYAPAAPVPAAAQQAALAQIAVQPDQASSGLKFSPNPEFGAPKVGRTTTGRSQSLVNATTLATGIVGKSASAIAATTGQSEAEPTPEPTPEPPHSELESVLVEAAPESETSTATGQPTPQAVSNAHQLTTAAVKSGPETVSNLAAQIVRNLEGRLTRFDVQLHPADLGRVDVRVEIGARGRVKASMSFENPQSAADLRGRSEELLRALESAGFDLSGGLSFDVAGDRGQGQPPPQQQAADSNNRHQGRAFDAAMALATDPVGDPRTGRLDIYQARRAAGLDIRI